MAKAETKPEKPTPTMEEVNDAPNKLILGQTSPVTMQEAFDFMENIDTTQLEDLSRSYFDFKEIGNYVFLFTGMSKAKIDNKEVEVVELENKAGEQFINANAMVVNACKRVTTLPCFIVVKYVGEQKAK